MCVMGSKTATTALMKETTAMHHVTDHLVSTVPGLVLCESTSFFVLDVFAKPLKVVSRLLVDQPAFVNQATNSTLK